jgi:UDP-3-O-[3-hydroxymyristoyl] N-acetylglucosamine deacetylase
VTRPGWVPRTVLMTLDEHADAGSADVKQELAHVDSNRRARQTLGGPTARLDGVGLHSGAAVWVRMEPGRARSGIVFRHSPSGQDIPARVTNVGDTTRCTQLKQANVVIQTVEHVMSALFAMGIDDVVVVVDGPELPALDGSAAPYVDIIQSVGIVAGDGVIEPLVVEDAVEVTDGRGGVIRVSPSPELRITVTLEYPEHAYIGTQTASFTPSSDDYRTDVAPARTFGFLTEIEQLHARGLALGASYDNAVVLGPDRYLVPCRFANELARHKLLDLYGDLALAGRPLVGDVTAVRPGHRLNTELAALLAA